MTVPPVPAIPGVNDAYLGAGTLVARNAGLGGTVADEGGVLCIKSQPLPSLGGGCVDFGTSVVVTDDLLGSQVAYQVCIDNNGDGICGNPILPFEQVKQVHCADQTFFSHADNGAFFNPLGPLPAGFLPGCPGGPWNGYVVMLCAAVHNAGDAHTHLALRGTMSSGPALGTGFGNFCNAVPPKPYRVG